MRLFISIYHKAVFRYPSFFCKSGISKNFFSFIRSMSLFSLYLELICVSINCFTFAFFATWAASFEVECFVSRAQSFKSCASVLSCIKRSAPALSFSRFSHGLVSPEYTIFFPGGCALSPARQDCLSVYYNRLAVLQF